MTAFLPLLLLALVVWGAVAWSRRPAPPNGGETPPLPETGPPRTQRVPGQARLRLNPPGTGTPPTSSPGSWRRTGAGPGTRAADNRRGGGSSDDGSYSAFFTASYGGSDDTSSHCDTSSHGNH
jgi:hypothetical protein